MRKRNSNRKNGEAMLDSDDCCSESSSSSVGVGMDVQNGSLLDEALSALYEKRPSTREALQYIIEAFSHNLQFATLLYQSLNSFKKGSGKEITLASHAIGLLALTTGPGDNAYEIVQDSVFPISQALKSKSESSKTVSLLSCLAVITFVCGGERKETEWSLQIMWQVVHPKAGVNLVANEPSPDIIAAMVSAWSFLLTTAYTGSLSLKDWQESISYLSTLLDKDDRSVRIAAGEALAVIFEVADFERFSSDDSKEGYVHLKGLQNKVLNQVRDLASEAGGKGAPKNDLNNQRNFFQNLLDFLKDGYCPGTSTKIGGATLTTSSWSNFIRLNFLKHFLQGGFGKHMQENSFLHDVFGFTPRKKDNEDRSIDKFLEKIGYLWPFNEKPVVHDSNEIKRERKIIFRKVENFSPIKKNGSPYLNKRLYKSPNSVASKARTKCLNNELAIMQDMKTGHFAVGSEDA